MVKRGTKSRNRTASPTPASPVASDLTHSPIRQESRAPRNNQRNTGTSSLHEVPEKVSSGLDSIDNMHIPYFLHAADHPGLSLVSNNLDGSNYNSWKVAMTIALESKNR